jgi:hypothetical protein
MGGPEPGRFWLDAVLRSPCIEHGQERVRQVIHPHTPKRWSGGDAQLPLDVGHHPVRQTRLAKFLKVLSDGALP